MTFFAFEEGILPAMHIEGIYGNNPNDKDLPWKFWMPLLLSLSISQAFT